MGSNRRAGFSLIEVITGITLVVLLMSVGLLRHGTEKSRGSSEGLARLLAAEMEAARAQARSSGVPVALCLPTQGQPHSASFYLLEGRARGRLTRERILWDEFPQAYAAVGYWGSDVEIAPDIPGDPDKEFWLPDNFSDFAFIFLPDGRVVTNDIPLVNGSYQVAVCSSVQWTKGQVDGTHTLTKLPPYNLLRVVSAPHLISVSPDGPVSLTSGAPGLDVAVYPSKMETAFAAHNPPAKPDVASPEVGSLEVLPAPVDEVANVTKRGTVTIRLTGTDLTGDDLFVEWGEEKVEGVATLSGAFSPSGRHRMVWNPELLAWESDVTWTPPPDSEVGDIFALSGTLSNSAGSEVALTSAALSNLEIIGDDQVILSSDSGLYKMNEKGLGLRQLLTERDPWYARFSPDGSKVVFQASRYDRDMVYVANSDGTDPSDLGLFDVNSHYFAPQWNSFGTRLFYESGRGVFSVKPDGTDRRELTPRLPGTSVSTMVVALSADSRYIAVMGHVQRIPGDRNSNSRDLYIAEIDGLADPPVLKSDWYNLTKDQPRHWPSDSTVFLSFHPQPADPNRPLLVMRGGGTAGSNLFTIQVNDVGGTGTDRFTADIQPLRYSSGKTSRDMDVAFSPDGTEVLTTRWWPTKGIFRYRWNTAGASPILTDEQFVNPNTQSFRHLTWR